MKIFNQYILLLILVISGKFVSAQNNPPLWTWGQNLGTTTARSVATDSIGNSYVTGGFNGTVTFGSTTLTSSAQDVFVVKYDSAGTVLWARKASSGAANEIGNDIAVDAAGNYYITGEYGSGNAVIGGSSLASSTGSVSDLFVVKFNAAGLALWAHKLGSSNVDTYGKSIAVDAAGDCFVASTGRSGTSYSLGFKKFTSTGLVGSFFANYSSVAIEQAGVSVDGFGNVYGTGTAVGTFGCIIIKLDPSGNQVWNRTIANAKGRDIVTDQSGNSYITGSFTGTSTFGGFSLTSAGLTDIFLAKYDAAGQPVWAKSAGGVDSDYGDGVALDRFGNSYVAGRFQQNAAFGTINISNLNSGISDIFSAKYTSIGDVEWVKQAGNGGADGGNKIDVDFDGNSYICGYFTTSINFDGNSIAGTNNSFLVKAKSSVPAGIAIFTTPLTSNVYTAGTAVSISFTVSGVFAANNFYTVELSGPSGSFFYPISIGTGLSSPINAVIPALSIPASGYRIRVVASNPNTPGTDNGSNISINGKSQQITPQWTWGQNLGTTTSNSVATDSIGNSYVTGGFSGTVTFGSTTLTSSAQDVFVVKYDSAGTVLWARKASSGAANEIGNDIAVDAAGNYYITGEYGSGNAVIGGSSLASSTGSVSDLFVVKFNAAGLALWAHKLGSSNVDTYGKSIAVDAAGDCFVASTGRSGTSYSLGFKKFTSTGLVGSFFANYSSVAIEQAGVSVDGFGNVYGTGTAVGTFGCIIIKLDPSGNQVWNRTIANAKGRDIVTDQSGNSYITGSFTGTSTFGGFSLTSAGLTDIFLAKYDAAGQPVWAKSAGGVDSDYGDGVALDTLGNCFVSGRFQHSAYFNGVNISNYNSGVSDVFVAKYSASGNILWVKQTGKNGVDGGAKISTDKSGNSYVSGIFGFSISFDNQTFTGLSNSSYLAKIGNYSPVSIGIASVIASNKICGGAVVKIEYPITGVFNTGNVFTAQLSDASGSFANPQIIGVENSATNNAIYAIMPDPPTGTGYKIRVISSNPALTGNNNGINISINLGYCDSVVPILLTYPLVAGEYFFNTDPGIGNGTPINVTSSDSISIVAPISVVGLALGFHNLFIRFKDTRNVWSMYEGRVVYVAPSFVSKDASPIVSAEYFFDTDPGVGNGTSIASFTKSDSINLVSAISVTGLNSGFHNVFIRTKDSLNRWSMYEGRIIYVQPPLVNLNVSPIISAEYFFDTDPGVGNGTSIASFTKSDSINIVSAISVIGLSTGFHNVFIRTKDSLNRWSMYEGRTIYVQPPLANLNVSPIISAEYFFDTDPGVGNGTSIASFTKSDSINLVRAISVTGLSAGFHNLFIRAKDSLNLWSMYEGRLVYVQPAPVVIQNGGPIVAAEYFFNTDPGINQGIAFSTGLPADSISINPLNIAATGLTAGTQKLFIRVKDSLGMWSLYEGRQFFVCATTLLPAPVITGVTMHCPGSTLSLAASTVVGATSYSWKGPNGFTASTQNITVPNLSSLTIGLYKVSAVKGTTTCDTGSFASVNVAFISTPISQSLMVNGSLNLCTDDSVSLSIPSQNDFSYRWLRNGTNTTNNADTLNSLIVKTSGTYTVKVTNTNGCFSNMRDTIVTVNPKPNTSVINGNGNVLVNSIQTYSVANTSSSSYNWIVSNGTINSGNGSNSISVTWPTSSGTGSVKVIETSATGCKGDTQTRGITINSFTLNVNPLSLSYTNSASSKKVGVSSNTSWSVSANQTWVTLNKTSGSNNDSVTVSLLANGTTVQRTATVTFTADSLTQVVNITQAGTPPNPIDSIQLSTNNLSYAASGNTQQVQLTSNKNWTVSGNASWVTLSPNNGNGNATVNVTTTTNASSLRRTNTITFTAGTATQLLTITQDSTPATADQLSLNKDSIIIGSSGTSTTVQLQSNRTWAITNPASWVTITPMNGTNNAILSVNISANNTSSIRTVDVLISAGAIIKELHIKQDATVGINEVNSYNHINIYPNPSSGIVTISSSLVIKNIDVFDVTGKLVFNQQNNNKQTKSELDLSQLSNGIYFIHALTENGGVGKSKVVLSK